MPSIRGERLSTRSLKAAKFSDKSKGIFSARALVIRDSDMSGSQFEGAYLYRTQMTGDNYSQMCLQNVSFKGANLVNSCFTADLQNSDFTEVTADYAHFVMSDCRGSLFLGAKLRGATLIKSKFSEQMFKPQDWPSWVDRCPGIHKKELKTEVTN